MQNSFPATDESPKGYSYDADGNLLERQKEEDSIIYCPNGHVKRYTEGKSIYEADENGVPVKIVKNGKTLLEVKDFDWHEPFGRPHTAQKALYIHKEELPAHNCAKKYGFDDKNRLVMEATYRSYSSEILIQRSWRDDGTMSASIRNNKVSNYIELEFDAAGNCMDTSYYLTTRHEYKKPVSPLNYYLHNFSQLWNKNRIEIINAKRPTFEEIVEDNNMQKDLAPRPPQKTTSLAV